MATSDGAKDAPLPPPPKQDIGPKDRNQNSGEKKDVTTPAIPSPINKTVTGDLQFKGADQQTGGQKHAFYESPEWWLVGATVVLVYVTARLVRFTKKLWSATNDLVIDAKKTSKRQAEEFEKVLALTKASAEAAQKQVKTAVNVDRPFVYVSNIVLTRSSIGASIQGIPGAPEFYEVGIEFTNYGRTPAFVIHVGFGHAIAAQPPPTPEYPVLLWLKKEVVIAPGKSHPFSVANAAFSISGDQRKAIQDGTIRPWLWGFIHYRDFFNGITESGFIASHKQITITGLAPGISGEFRFGGPAAYTYQHYKESDE